MPSAFSLLPALLGVLLSPHTHVRVPTPTHRVRGAVSMSEEGDSAAARLAALEQQMQELKIAALEKQMAELQADGAAPTAEQLETKPFETASAAGSAAPSHAGSRPRSPGEA